MRQEGVCVQQFLLHCNHIPFLSHKRCKCNNFYYGVATISRLLKITGLFCRISSLLLGSLAKETYNFKEPTNRSDPICYNYIYSTRVLFSSCVCIYIRFYYFAIIYIAIEYVAIISSFRRVCVYIYIRFHYIAIKYIAIIYIAMISPTRRTRDVRATISQKT